MTGRKERGKKEGKEERRNEKSVLEIIYTLRTQKQNVGKLS